MPTHKAVFPRAKHSENNPDLEQSNSKIYLIVSCPEAYSTKPPSKYFMKIYGAVWCKLFMKYNNNNNYYYYYYY